MTALTWRNVDAPDFGRSIEGIRTFGSMFDNALSGLREGVQKYDQTISRNMNNQFALDLMKYQDAEAYKNALEAGEVTEGYDPRRLSAASIQAANGRTNDLFGQEMNRLNIANTNQNMEQNAYNFGRIKDRNAGLDEARSILPGFYEAASQGKGREFLTQNLDKIKGLNFEDMSSMFGHTDAAYLSRLNVDNTVENQRQNGVRWNWAVEDREMAKKDLDLANQAQAAMAEFSSTYGDNDSAMAALNEGLRSGKYTPKLYNYLRTGLLGGALIDNGGSSGDFTGSLPKGTGGANALRIMNYEARASGINSVPANVQTLGQASDFSLRVNAANKKRTGKNGSSAMGLYQIVGQTMRSVAPKVLGPNWRNEAYNAENQDKLAKYIFENNNGSAQALRNQWVSLGLREAEQVRKMPWEQARQIIAKKESNGDPSALLTGASPVGEAVADRAQQNSFIERNYSANFAPTLARDLTAKDGSLSGMSRGYVNQMLRETIAKAKKSGVTLSPKMAEEILVGSVSSDWISRNLPSILGGGDKNGERFDTNLIDENIAQYASGQRDQQYVANAAATDIAVKREGAKNLLNAQIGRFQNAVRQQQRGITVPNIGAIRQDAINAQILYDSLTAGAQNQGVVYGGKPVARNRPAVPKKPAVLSAPTPRAPISAFLGYNKPNMLMRK